MKTFTQLGLLYVVGIALSIMLMTSSCQQADAGSTGGQAPGIWEKISGAPRAYGPYTYVTQNPILLPDGTHAVCISTNEHLWCKEVETQ